MIKNGWKVVSKNLRSPYVTELNATVQYYVGKYVTHPKDCGPLAVFKTRSAVRKFTKDHPSSSLGTQIFKCKYTTSLERRLWNYYSIKEEHIPEGTDFADEVMLLKKSR